MIKAVYIYKLVDRHTSEVYYVGATSQTLEKRLQMHRQLCGSKRMKELFDSELDITIELIEATTNISAATREKYWIDYYSLKGFNLRNGKHYVSYPNSTPTRLKLRTEKINQYSLAWNLVKTWESIDEINEAGFNEDLICSALMGWRKSSQGFRWEFNKKELANSDFHHTWHTIIRIEHHPKSQSKSAFQPLSLFPFRNSLSETNSKTTSIWFTSYSSILFSRAALLGLVSFITFGRFLHFSLKRSIR